MTGLEGAGDLGALLARADRLLDRAAAAERAGPVDPRVRAALVAVTGADAPLAERSVAEQVRRGRTAWEQVWQDPHVAGPESVRVVQRAVVVLARDLGPPAT